MSVAAERTTDLDVPGTEQAAPALLRSQDFRALFVSSFLVDLGLCLYFFTFSLFLVEHHFREQQIGFITASLTVGTVAGTLPASFLIRRYGLRPVMVGYALIAPLLLASRTIFLQVPSQLVLGFLAGIAMSLWTVCFAPTVARLTTKKNRTLGFSIFVTMGIGSGAIAGIIGGYLPGFVTSLKGHASTDGIRVVLWLACATVGVAAAGLIRLRRDTPMPASSLVFGGFLTRFLVAVGVWSFALNFFTSFSNVYLVRELHLPIARIGNIYSVCQVAQVVMVLSAPLLYRRVGLLVGIAMTQICTGFVMLALSRAHGVRSAVGLYIALAAVQWMSGPGISALLMNQTPVSQRGRAAAGYNVVNMAAGATATVIAGRAFQQFRFAGPLRVDALVAICAAMLLFVLLRGMGSHVLPVEEGAGA